MKLFNVQWVCREIHTVDIHTERIQYFNTALQRVPFIFPVKFSNSSQGKVKQRPFSFEPRTVTENLFGFTL